MENQDYSFSKCVKNSVTNKIGCKLDFGRKMSKEEEEGIGKKCTALGRVRKYEETYLEMFRKTKTNLLKRIGCLTPCQFMDYAIVDTRAGRKTSESVMPLMRSLLKQKNMFTTWFLLLQNVEEL